MGERGENFEYARMFADFPFALRRFLNEPLSLPAAQRIVRQRMEDRAENFLRTVERAIYGAPGSPYLKLLKYAGCELQDVRYLVRQRGVEGALKSLRASGVYVTYEELKGRKPIVRGQLRIRTKPRDFDNPVAQRHFSIRTSGSTGLAHTIHQNLDALADETPFRRLIFEAHGIYGAPYVLWSGFLPGASLRGTLMNARMGQGLTQWFAPGGWRDSQYWVKYGLATLYVLGCFRALGRPLPFPEVVRPNQAERVARCLDELCRKHTTVVMFGGVSAATRVCIAAKSEGMDLRRCVFMVTGEPLSDAKAAQIRAVGARMISAYGLTEAGMVGCGCAKGHGAADIHLQQDVFAMFDYPFRDSASGITIAALNLTTLLETAPMVLLNAQIDDMATIRERDCGCGVNEFGYPTHLYGIKSYSKLVGEGVTLLGNDLLQILENILPARFGGSMLDYQLLEEDDENGLTRLYLLVAPRLHIENEAEIVSVVLEALSASSPMGDAARRVWQNAQTLKVRRAEPIWSRTGKLLPLHAQRRGNDERVNAHPR